MDGWREGGREGWMGGWMEGVGRDEADGWMITGS